MELSKIITRMVLFLTFVTHDDTRERRVCLKSSLLSFVIFLIGNKKYSVNNGKTVFLWRKLSSTCSLNGEFQEIVFLL